MIGAVLHRSLQLAARGFGGAYGQIEPVALLPERDAVTCGEVTLSLLRYPGRGRPLVLLHGLNNNAWSWVRVAAQLALERPVVCVSLRGHGRSSAPAAGYALADTTADVVALIGALGGGPVDLGGHSWGGRVAMHVAATAPALVASLVLADPVPPRGFNPLLRRFPGLVYAALGAERGPFPDRAALAAGRARVLHLALGDPIDLLAWEESFREQPDGSFAHVLPEAGYRALVEGTLCEDLTPLLGGVRCPTLLLRPTFSVGFWPGETRPYRALPRLTVRRVPGDHSFIHTNPRDTEAAIRGHLAAG